MERAEEEEGACFGGGGMEICTYERNVDLPHSGSPSKRIETVGVSRSSINCCYFQGGAWLRDTMTLTEILREQIAEPRAF
jgi:hypothetical protein